MALAIEPDEMLDFDEAKLRDKIETLSKRLRPAFAAACAQRLQPSYRRFVERSGRGDIEKVGGILERVWTDLSGNPISRNEIDLKLDECMDLIPREDDGPWLPGQAAAEDAVTALAYTLRCRQNGSAQEAAWAARHSSEAIDRFVIDREDIDLNKAGEQARILADPLVQMELLRQRRDLEDLLRRKVSVIELRDRAKIEAEDFLPGLGP